MGRNTPQPLTTYWVEGRDGQGPIAIDAGSIGLVGEPEDMARIEGVVLTHCHIDHVATLPMWIEANLSQGKAPVEVTAMPETVAALRAHLFNDVIFPDFERLTEADGRPLMAFREVSPGQPFALAGFSLEAVRVHHPVPTCGYLVDDGRDAVLLASDSGPTGALWRVANNSPRLRAVVLETSFPDSMQAIADDSGHLTPATLKKELMKAPSHVTIYINHMKPAYRGEIAAAIAEMGDRHVKILEPGVEMIIGR